MTSSTGSTANSQMWKGEYLAYRKDPEAGPELQYATHHRNYNPKTGVFTSADPAKEDLNLYRYVKNNPVNRTDPSGLEMFMFDAGAEAGEIHSSQRAQQEEFRTAVASLSNALRGINQHAQSIADAIQEVEQTGEPRDELIENYSQHIDRLMHEYVRRRNRVLELIARDYGSGITAEDVESYFKIPLPPFSLVMAMGSDFAIPKELQAKVNQQISSVSEGWDKTAEVAEGMDEGLFWVSLATAGVGVVLHGVRIATTEGGRIIVRKAVKEIGVGAARLGAGAAAGMAVGAGINAASDQLVASDQQKAWISLGIDLAAAFILRRRNSRKAAASPEPNSKPGSAANKRANDGLKSLNDNGQEDPYGTQRVDTPKSISTNGGAHNNSSTSRWTRTEQGGRRVFQKNDLFDPQRLDDNGLTNLQRMHQGKAPIGIDGEPVNLHHLTGDEPGNVAEVGGVFHSENMRILH